jgi:hypothetical protein
VLRKVTHLIFVEDPIADRTSSKQLNSNIIIDSTKCSKNIPKRNLSLEIGYIKELRQ